jgi:hypothetical protein
MQELIQQINRIQTSILRWMHGTGSDNLGLVTVQNIMREYNCALITEFLRRNDGNIPEYFANDGFDMNHEREILRDINISEVFKDL